MSKRGRLIVILVVGFVLFLVPVVLLKVGQRQVREDEARIRTRAATARIATSDLLAAMVSTDGADAIANALGVGFSDVSYHQADPPTNWCVNVDIERLIAKGHLSFIVQPDGSVHSVPRC